MKQLKQFNTSHEVELISSEGKNASYSLTQDDVDGNRKCFTIPPAGNYSDGCGSMMLDTTNPTNPTNPTNRNPPSVGRDLMFVLPYETDFVKNDMLTVQCTFLY